MSTFKRGGLLNNGQSAIKASINHTHAQAHKHTHIRRYTTDKRIELRINELILKTI